MAHSNGHTAPPPAGLHLAPFSEEHGRELCSWHYEPPYDLFNWPGWEQMQQQGIEFGDPGIRDRQYTAILDEHHELIGYAQFFPLLGVTRLGLGLRPSLCSQGLGPAVVSLLIREAFRRSPDDELDLEVLTWNERAVRAYQKAGFEITDRYWRPTPTGPGEFYCMVYRRPFL
ncbi:GNAT family N-acetyltransferase [Paenibacillus sambharensis]|uniref:GNAT family N-acetyltransferase n=1 Tax=Paenibacillus sambharensis TaxID=1803190 RepID=A0A2W1LNB5_9BACL|nr:GNAT family N-acetyltransferase [Paenibacillus sambharensis]PZD96422.1 GNAT family N-acetyltransferase [Paenibacillus sambharensis]